MVSGSINGSSPCILITMSYLPPRDLTASLQRSVPLGQSGSVMTTRAPAALQTSAMRSSSVATTTASRVLALQACS